MQLKFTFFFGCLLAWASTTAQPNADDRSSIYYSPLDVQNIRTLSRSEMVPWKSYKYQAVSSIGKLKALTIFVDFEDRPGDALQTENLAEILEKSDTLNSFYRQVSRGKLSVKHDFHHGWRRMLRKAYEFHEGHRVVGPKNPRMYAEEAMKLFPDIDFTQYDLVNIATPPIWEFSLSPTHYYVPTPSGNRVGVVTLGNDSYQVKYPRKILIHEYAHQMGLPDLYPYPGEAGPEADIVLEGAMGGLDMMAHLYDAWTFVGFHQYFLGWLPKDRITFLKGNSWEGSISPLMGDSGTSLIIWTAPHRNDRRPVIYCIESIQPPRKSRDWQPSVIVYSVDVYTPGGKFPVWLHRNPSETLLQGPLLSGEILDDPKLPFLVEVVGQGGSDYDVKITVR